MAYSMSRRPSRSRRWPVLLLIVAVLGAVLTAWRIGPSPLLEVEAELPGIGPRTAVRVAAQVVGGRGLSSLELTLVQGEQSSILLQQDLEPRPAWAFWGPRVLTFEERLDVGAETLPDLQPGEAILRWTAQRAATWLRSPDPVIHEVTLPVVLTPPSLGVLAQPVIVDQGGAGVVIYAVGEGAVQHGVEWGEQFFPGTDALGSRQVAFYGAPHDQDSTEGAVLVVVDELGNRRAIPFIDTFRRRDMTHDDIRLSEGFMQKVTAEIYSQTPSLKQPDDLLEAYIQLNRDLRRQNSERLQSLSEQSADAILWRGGFEQLPNSRVMAPFADRRTYRLAGEAVDQQDHLGYDLASVRQAPVPAANSGRVLLAEYLGIYGNTVVVDHGLGLMSLYSHLSSLEVEVGQDVVQGDILGRTGETGLAGGDHLHFSMLVRGRQVRPLEWWDSRWIEQRIVAPMGDLWPGD